jgi:hypothetical protein
MTLATLLEELWDVDAKAYDDIPHLELVGWQQPRNQAMDHLQGCLQRACERRGWHWHAAFGCVTGRYIGTANQSTEVAGSAAEALLAAYIAAVRVEAKL